MSKINAEVHTQSSLGKDRVVDQSISSKHLFNQAKKDENLKIENPKQKENISKFQAQGLILDMDQQQVSNSCILAGEKLEELLKINEKLGADNKRFQDKFRRQNE